MSNCEAGPAGLKVTFFDTDKECRILTAGFTFTEWDTVIWPKDNDCDSPGYSFFDRCLGWSVEAWTAFVNESSLCQKLETPEIPLFNQELPHTWIQDLPKHPCMFDGLKPGVYGLVCTCPRCAPQC